MSPTLFENSWYADESQYFLEEYYDTSKNILSCFYFSHALPLQNVQAPFGCLIISATSLWWFTLNLTRAGCFCLLFCIMCVVFFTSVVWQMYMMWTHCPIEKCKNQVLSTVCSMVANWQIYLSFKLH